MSTDLDKELSDAIEQSIASPPIRSTLLKRPASNGESRRAVDQLTTAVAGLLKVEEEMNSLLADITGTPDEAEKSHPPATDLQGLPMFDRVRTDATTLAELAIRMHAKIAYAKERL